MNIQKVFDILDNAISKEISTSLTYGPETTGESCLILKSKTSWTEMAEITH